MVVTIETDRLVIRPVVPDDAEAIFKWASDPEVTKYMIYTTHPNAEYTREWLESRDITDEDSYDLGFVFKATGELIGMGGLVYKKEEDVWVIGYNLRKCPGGYEGNHRTRSNEATDKSNSGRICSGKR